MQRLTRELAEAETEIKTAKVATSEVEDTLNRALVAASHCERAYLTAPSHVKRQINRGFSRSCTSTRTARCSVLP
jgi:hypothetical protein